MNFRPNLLKPVGPNALAQEADFKIGALRVSPSRLEIRAGDKQETTQPRVMQVFVTMAGARGAVVSRDELIGRCWSGRIVGEDAISRCVAKVRELANLATPPAFEIETIPRVGYRLKPAATETASARPLPTAGNTVLAVLAFDNLSKDADLEFFSEGVSEEILQTVARSPELIVIGRSSSFQFRGADKAAARVASVLKATHVLDGSVRRDRSRVRISASLIECVGETTLWSHRFDRDLSDVFALQDEIAAAVAAALKVTFLPSGQSEAAPAARSASGTSAHITSERSQIDPDAYTAYLQGRFLLNRRNHADMRRAANFFKEALAIIPDYVDARASLAHTYAILVGNGQSPQSLSLARQETEAALSLEPNHFEALISSASVSVSSWKWTEAHATYRRLLARHPNDAEIHHYFGWFLTTLQLPELWLREHRRAAALDPLLPIVRFNIGEALHMLGRDEEAVPEYQHALTLDPDMAFSLCGLCAAYASTGRLEEAKAVLRDRLVAADGADGLFTVRAQAMIAYRETGGVVRLPALARDAEQHYAAGSVNPGLVALIHALAGDFDVALEWFQKSIDEHDLLFFDDAAEPSIPAAFKSDPRWRAFMQQPALQEWARVRSEVIAGGVG